MKYVNGKIFITMIVTLSLFMSIASADPSVDGVTTDPASPTHQSTITVTATITGDDISSVNLTVSECKEGLCFIYTDYTMTQNDNGDWVAEATLEDTSKVSTYIQYLFAVVDDGVEFPDITSDDWKVDLTIENGGSGNGGNGGNGLPGFGIITLLVAIIIGTVLLRKKRF
ncbi:MAG: hypothetical protein V3W20_06740 [Candidatus Neomarinimicrobiota bacterium]